MAESTKLCKDFIEDLVKIERSSEKANRTWVMERGWPGAPNHKAINKLLSRLSVSEKETLLYMLQDSTRYGIGTVLNQLSNHLIEGEWKIVSGDDEMPVWPCGLTLHLLWGARCKGEPWPDEAS